MQAKNEVLKMEERYEAKRRYVEKIMRENAEIETLTENRKQLRNESKRKNCSNLNEVKEDISEIGKRLKELRKEILLIDDIAERSNEIEEKLEQAEIDEQKKLQKEEKYRE